MRILAEGDRTSVGSHRKVNSGFLSNYFTGVGTKVLTRVDATPHSNQHEIGDRNRGDALMRILGDTPRKKNNRFNAKYVWLNHEEAIFRWLERRIVSGRIVEGFVSEDSVDVDGFLNFSLSVQNKWKSRMGDSFQNQLSAVFDAHELRYGEQVTTEINMKPDFIFPGRVEYFDSRFDVTLLTMWGAKSTCKDRWSQILPEAKRIPLKHLVTLEPAISETQTETMRNSHVQLVVPAAIQASYTEEQRDWLNSVADFVNLVARRRASPG